MGNRAVIAFSKDPQSVGVYVHWNGGVESVSAFVEVCKRRGYRDPLQDPQYAMARLIGVIHEFFNDGLSVGVGTLSNLDIDNHDNGAYIVGPSWQITHRWGKGSNELLTTGNQEVTQQIIESLSGKGI